MGYPVDNNEFKKWLNCSKKPWGYCKENKIEPDLVLIDGRFRVASFITSCLNVTKKTTVLFDDYVERPFYHSVENIIKPIEFIDNRMAVFEITPNMIDNNYLLENLDFYLDPR